MGKSCSVPVSNSCSGPDIAQSKPAPNGNVAVNASSKNDFFYDAWDRFLAPEPTPAEKTSTIPRKIEEDQRDIQQVSGEGLHVEENAATSWKQAVDVCQARVDAIVKECSPLNRKYVDHSFDLENHHICLKKLNGRCPNFMGDTDALPWVKRVEDIFEKPVFFIDGADANHVHQGIGGDCWFLAALIALTAKKELINNVCIARNEKVGVYGFVFYRDGEWIPEVIDDKLYLNVGDTSEIVRNWSEIKKKGKHVRNAKSMVKKLPRRGGEALFFSRCKSHETWLPLIEKAYAKAHGDYTSLDGGYAGEAIEDLTGGVGLQLDPEDIMDKDRFWKEKLSFVNEKYLFSTYSKLKTAGSEESCHVYAVLGVYEEGDLRLLKLRNPWGHTDWEGDWSDGSKLWTRDMITKLGHTFGNDGIFWMTYSDFLKQFARIDRVRLFDKSWQVSQQWTCVKVPWTVDYLDTKFEFIISERGPVVIVLVQPDERYYKGLAGRFGYSFHFQVYKNGSEDRCIVRTMCESGGVPKVTRSVSAEMEDADPGTYSVVFKITPTRWGKAQTSEAAINEFALDRKEKLLAVGRKFDYAQSKGNLRAAEAAAKRQERHDGIREKHDELRKERKLAKKEAERQGRKKDRADALQRKRRAEHEKAVQDQTEAEKHADKEVQDDGGSQADHGSRPPIPELQEVKDTDFTWDPTFDAPVEDSDEESLGKGKSTGARTDTIFGTDPWRALCVLGLRVYSQNSEAEVRVVRGGEVA
ncbi:hypothetical protein LTR62_001217 [Meristemomyces frigidus]|uniref:Calpain catalytic domain-containing protein n=1 Tax=Meristemomyces frigidus TaxID=1508187 RepID=A0AAN7YSQ1_9PEZI|nr:hypothetical protein LTR62_001217 [Meristemomyces frigidus]